jgi:hypothetical protein
VIEACECFGQDGVGRHFWRHRPISGGRDGAIPRLRLQSRGKLKTIPRAAGNSNCALRGGAGNSHITSNKIAPGHRLPAPASQLVSQSHASKSFSSHDNGGGP